MRNPGPSYGDESDPAMLGHVRSVYQIARKIERDLEQLSNDQAARFDQVDQRFDQVDQRFESVDRRFEDVDRRLDGIDQRLDGMDLRFDQIDDRLASIIGLLGGSESAG